MATVSVYNMEGNEVGTIELNDAVFGVDVNEHLVHMAVVAQLANKRQGRPLLHSLQISVRERRKQRPVLKYPAAEESPGDRREPVMQDRVQQELPSGRAAAWYSHPYREITPSA